MITKPIFPFRSTPITSLFHYSLNGAQLPVLCLPVWGGMLEDKPRLGGIREQGCRNFSEGPCRSEQAWRRNLVGMMLERSRQSHREGGSTPRRGTGASTPFHRPTPGPGVTWEAGRGQKSRERDMPTAPCARERNIASRLPPFGPSATPADAAQTYDSGGGGLALRYPGPIPLRCPLSTTGINPSVFETA